MCPKMADLVRFGRFVATGGIAAVVNVGLRILFNLAMPYEMAVAVAYLIAMALAFTLSKLFVFAAADGATSGQFIRFALVNLVSLCIVWVVSVGLYRVVFPALSMTWRPDLVAHLLGVLSPVFAAYLLHKHFTFGKEQE